jgi:hypothetical protein
MVKVFAIRDGAADTSVPLNLGQTDDGGIYTVDVGDYKGAVMVEVSGGSFKDEVSGAQVALKKPMRAILSGASTGTNAVAVTPITHLASKIAEGRGALTAAAIDDANVKMSAMFQLADIVKTMPVAGGAVDQKKYADACGVISQLANDGKRAGESLDDSLARVMGEMETEMAQSGGLSGDTLNRINAAVTKFDKSGATATAPLPAGGMIKIGTAGATNAIGAIDMTISLPDGTIVAADTATGDAIVGTVTISGVAAVGTNKLLSAKVTPASGVAPARLAISMSNAAGFGRGECVTIGFIMFPGAAFPANAAAFSVTGFVARGPDGLPISGVTAAPTSLTAL